MFASSPSTLSLRTPILGATVLALGLGWGSAQAQGAAAPMDHSQHGAHSAAAADSPAAPQAAAAADPAAVLTPGEITRVDARGAKLTIRHGEITNLGMPAMTMVFGLKDSTQLAQFKPGDQVRFHVEDAQGQLLITHIEAAH
ncbi:copper-binding protein [Comamonas terrigena]|uniref:copper-binding protein n=1 Tax=Comamonas terrigena TaxID=32013 RepID=UPI002448533D|nr:copper-binding protein [Comamonas terrigena]MDH0050925.1 copper-binding protein [Comamonas terrigena]MDH0513269.1 copper-binding protein [Comamonas terrigena]MDH1092685.1 copper-binding protein [Comamonas terrigena]MDH1502873.1 copper-binding protein [Comamonas terrigena]